MAKNDLEKIMGEVDTDNMEIQNYIAFIDYELYSDAQKVKELEKMDKLHGGYDSYANIVYEEEFGTEKHEKRKAYYLTGDNNLYKSVRDNYMLSKFIKAYGRDIVMNET